MNNAYRRIYDFFAGEGFLPLDSKSYPIIKKYNRGSLLQEKSAVMFVVWHYNYFGLYKVIGECLCSVFFYESRAIYWTIHRPEENSTYPLEPIVDTLCGLCKKAGLPFLQVKFVDEDLLAQYRAVSRHDPQVTCFEDNGEYAYKTKDLTNLTGPANYYKRKRVKKFLDMPGIEILPMTNKTFFQCFSIEDEWCTHQDCSYCGSFTGCEKTAMEAMADIFDETIHTGLFLYHNGKPVGYIICERISEKLSFLYFGKSIIQDGFVYLIYVMYRDYLSGVEYMNMSEDMGHEGLRRFKRLLSPHELWRKYIVTYSLAETA
jgi:hypothetical protein